MAEMNNILAHYIKFGNCKTVNFAVSNYMKTYIKYLVLLLFTGQPFQSAIAGSTPIDSLQNVSLTLDQIWQRAESYNKSVQIRQLHLESSVERIKDAKADRLPEINAEGEYAKISNMPLYENGVFHTPAQFEVLHTTYKAGGDAYFNLYNGHKVNLEIEARKSENKIAIEEKKLTISEIKLRAAAYYLDMQRSSIFKDLLIKDISTQEKQLLRIQALQKNGAILKSDVLRAELKLSRQRLSLVQLNNDLGIANQKLNILIGFPDEQQIVPVYNSKLDSLQLKPYGDYLADASADAYELKISEQETKLRELQLKNVKANVSPKIGLFAEYSYNYPQIFLYPYSPYVYGLGLAGIKASFSISSIYHTYHKAKAAKLEYASQEVEHTQVQDAVRQRVNESYVRYNESLNRIEVTRKNIVQATENLRIVNKSYFNQLALVTDLLDADTQLLQTHFDMAAAKIAAQLQYYQLLNATGKL